MARDRPEITLKMAQTLDGRVATASGHSRWVSGPESRIFAHRLRTEHDAILVGIGTVLADDPQLDARLWHGPSPVKIILDRTLRTPSSARLLQANPPHTIIASTEQESEERAEALRLQGASILRLPEVDSGVDLQALLEELLRIGHRSVLVEGGATVATSFLRHRLVDRVVVIVAPKILGAGIDAVGNLGATRMSDALQLTDLTVERSGEDLILNGTPEWHL